MRLHTLALQAFGPFRTRQSIDFDTLSQGGLFLLHGATGAGKSTIFDAVCYALYGNVPGERHQTALRSHHADPATLTQVELEFSMAGRRLRIVRTPQQERARRDGNGTTRSQAKASLEERHGDDSLGRALWKPVSAAHQEIAREIEALLGMNREQFCQVVLLPQGDFARFLRAKAEDRATVLGRLFGTHRFRDIARWLTDHAKESGQRCDDARRIVLRDIDRIQDTAGTPITDSVEEPAPTQDSIDTTHPTALAWAQAVHGRAAEAHQAAAAALRDARAHHSIRESRAAQVRILAERQLRHRTAASALTALRAQAPAFEDLQATLERGRRAEQVRPLIQALDDADHDHQKARHAEAQARTRLADTQRNDTDEELTATEDRLKNDLGRLDALRHDEQRSEELAASLAKLKAELDQAQSDHDEIADWLDQADTRRAEHTARIDRAHLAQIQADRLAAALPALEQQLAAARRRDELAANVAKAQSDVDELKKAVIHSAAHARGIRDRRIDGMAGELAARLSPQEPCLVCGSPVHPRPATTAAGHPSREDEARAEEAYQQADQACKDAEQDLVRLTAEAASAQELADGQATADLQQRHRAAQQAHKDLLVAAADAVPANEELRAFDETRATRTSELASLGRRIGDYLGRQETQSAEQEILTLRLADALAGSPTIAARSAELTAEAEALARARAAIQQVAVAAGNLDRAARAVATEIVAAGFATPEEARHALIPGAELAAKEGEMDAWRTAQATHTATLQDPDLAEAAAAEPADEQAAEAALAAAADRSEAAAIAESTSRDRCETLLGHIDDLTQGIGRLAPLLEEHHVAKHLADLAAGTSGDNQYRMHLEAYVLAARLEEVAKAANTRLERMSSGRYVLSHTDARTSGRGRSGLGLEILDQWTGQTRDTTTLSGGESFFASLALALGLADVVAQEAGGSQLDTLFIDEGFGSLDDETLEEVLEVLDELRSYSRTVGVVSHVADLRRRIPTQMQVRKSQDGSTVKAMAAAPAY
ncbi:AAA family ATPase [Kitasatospora cathayae]|uniref:Nuclease SbcCD subunit C n=1 Tax=Kitasatospora cathayae TaxID=3004092 RepID=A0ABY7QF15_9ACTN|nr:SMC family ATPase [Kitasatospora sp. HUAS 3-15]WBP91136.1 SMC family ATPase [Kitasatospora sp. HUAS 3-15]